MDKSEHGRHDAYKFTAEFSKESNNYQWRKRDKKTPFGNKFRSRRCNASNNNAINLCHVVDSRNVVKKMTDRKRTGTSSRRRSNQEISFSLTIVCLIIFPLILYDEIGDCAPVHRHHRLSTSAQIYLLKFGYLPQSGFEIRDQVSEERMKEAIRELQRFAHIKVTGEIDEETKKVMKKPRCGVPDVLSGQYSFKRRYKRFIIQGQKWPRTNLTWSLKQSSPVHRDQDLRDEISRAFAVWSHNTPLTFTQLPREKADSADIRIVFTTGNHNDGYPFDGKGAILAHAFFPGTGQGGDAHFDDDEIWIVNTRQHFPEGTRFFSVAAHEFGHSLGLSHSDVDGALMYPWYQNFDYNLTLSRDDMLGIHRIYGSTSKWAANPYGPGRNGNRVPRPNRPSGRRPPPPPSGGRPIHPDSTFPRTCDTSYDAISLIRDELFIFKGRYFWRINSTPNDNRLLKGYPSLITNMWQQLPHNLSHVDAVFEFNEVEIVFFIGRQYWRFKGTNLVHGYPQPLTSMGISRSVDHIDGAMTWGHNGKTYLFSGTQYWRLHDDATYRFTVEPDYPRDMYVWRGVPYHIDSVLRWKDGNTYFFKGKGFWKFNDKYMEVEDSTPTLSAPFWMGCTSNPIPPVDGHPSKGTTFRLALTLHLFVAFNCIFSSILSLKCVFW